MTSHVHFDEVDVLAALKKGEVELEKQTTAPGHVGVQARLNLAITTGAHLAIVREMNRGSDFEGLSNGVASVCANMVHPVGGDGVGNF